MIKNINNASNLTKLYCSTDNRNCHFAQIDTAMAGTAIMATLYKDMSKGAFNHLTHINPCSTKELQR